MRVDPRTGVGALRRSERGAGGDRASEHTFNGTAQLRCVGQTEIHRASTAYVCPRFTVCTKCTALNWQISKQTRVTWWGTSVDLILLARSPDERMFDKKRNEDAAFVEK